MPLHTFVMILGYINLWFHLFETTAKKVHFIFSAVNRTVFSGGGYSKDSGCKFA